MKVVIDTNVVVSAALKDRDPERVVLFVVENENFQWFASPEILAEYLDVLSRAKFGLPPSVVDRWREFFRTSVTIIERTFEVVFPRDPKDAKFLACALAADAEFLISGDKDFSDAYKIGNTTVFSVSQFKLLVCDVW